MASAADIYATAQAEAVKKRFDSLISNQTNAYNQQVSSTESARQNLLNQIGQQKTTVENQFQTDAKGAYTNKMLSGQTLANQLQRMGLYNSGYGVSQQLSNESAYSKNLTNLQESRNTSLDTLNTNERNTNVEYDQLLAQLSAANSTSTNDINKYINEQYQSAYNNAYTNYLNELQVKAAQQAAQAQQEAPVVFGNPPSGPQIIHTDYYNDVINPDAQNGTFGTLDKNGVRYQPDNVGGSKLSKSGKKVKQVLGTGTTGASGAILDNQTVWKSANGKYYVWDGSQNRYIDITTRYNGQTSAKGGRGSFGGGGGGGSR